eukprot:TRINITY_DN35271_c0_g1_i1.p1 TRINITY_DN35271_c0_g1~~TRINITY_DN35271_c0_g1_i1.p1  ORF type:complete len:521 (+),score=175.09 TRINITY_DN35271_c0_g1_i1:75-1565(+)
MRAGRCAGRRAARRRGSAPLGRAAQLRCWGAAPQLSGPAQIHADIERQVEGIVRDVISPADSWSIFGADVIANRPASPTVLLLGNHSSGKSTFINNLMGVKAQETGVAPTDDGFTVLTRGEADLDEDGPTLVGTQSHGFQDLAKYGPQFVNHFRMKVRRLQQDSRCPKGLVLIDSPGMVDTAMRGAGLKERGYDFTAVTRWFAERADVILLFFDPANPGTTSETLEILSRSLADLEHKTVIVLNKVDLFDCNADFARAYGTLCWNLSKVIPRKDIPRIMAMFNRVPERAQQQAAAEMSGLPLKEFELAREEVIKEVLRAPSRRVDNILTVVEQTAARLLLVSRVCENLRSAYTARKRSRQLWLAAGVMAAPAALAVSGQGALAVLGGTVAAAAAGAGAANFVIQRGLSDYQRLLVARLDSVVREEFRAAGGEDELAQDVQARFEAVRPKMQRVLESTELSLLPKAKRRELASLEELLSKRIPGLREMALRARSGSA